MLRYLTIFSIFFYCFQVSGKVDCDLKSSYIEKLISIALEKESKGLDSSKFTAKAKSEILEIEDNCEMTKFKDELSQIVAKGKKTKNESQESCRNFDNSSKIGPIISQGKSGFCYGYTAAAMLSAKLGVLVSHSGVAGAYKVNKIFSFFDRLKGRESFRSGFISSSILASKKNLCLESELSSDFKLTNWEELYKDIKTQDIRGVDCIYLKSILNEFSEVNDFIKIAKALEEKEFMSLIMDKTCKTKLTHDYTVEDIDEENFSSQVDRILSSGEVVGIEFDPGFYQEGTRYTGKQYSHAATIVGSKWDSRDKKCLYKLRDSMWSSCEDTKNSVNSIYHCEDGHIWVPRSTIQNNYKEALYLN